MLPVPSVHGQQGWGPVGLGVTGLGSLSAAGLWAAQAFPSLASGPAHSRGSPWCPWPLLGRDWLAQSFLPIKTVSPPSRRPVAQGALWVAEGEPGFTSARSCRLCASCCTRSSSRVALESSPCSMFPSASFRDRAWRDSRVRAAERPQGRSVFLAPRPCSGLPAGAQAVAPADGRPLPHRALPSTCSSPCRSEASQPPSPYRAQEPPMVLDHRTCPVPVRGRGAREHPKTLRVVEGNWQRPSQSQACALATPRLTGQAARRHACTRAGRPAQAIGYHS